MPVVSRLRRARWRRAIFATLLLPGLAFAQDRTIDGAVFPLPPQLRAGATVVRLTAALEPEVVRAGTNGMTCIADYPKDDEFDVRCYRDSFIPVVYRSFQLGSEEKINAELKSGKLALSKEPTAGYRCSGPIAGYDAARNASDARVECWESLHFPYRTAAEVGFPDEADVPEDQQRSTPYVMSSGTYWSHVMFRQPDAH
jgi:hypothetical protein